MKKLAIGALALTTTLTGIVAETSTASAAPYGWHGGGGEGWRGGGEGWRGGYRGGVGPAVVAGLAGLAIGAAIARPEPYYAGPEPYYAGPAPYYPPAYYYAPPPAYYAGPYYYGWYHGARYGWAWGHGGYHWMGRR